VSLWRRLAAGARALARRAEADREIADEVQDYLDRAAAEHVANGLTPEAARRAARLELGSPSAVREAVRAYGWENAVEVLFADLRFAARRLRHEPGFTAIAAVTMAVGIGATTAILSAVAPILFQPLPYPAPGRIVMLWDRGTDGSRLEATFGNYQEIRDRARSYEALAVMKPWQPTLTGPAEPERVDGQRVSAEYFKVLGVSPVIGRVFEAAADRQNGPREVILGDGIWRRRFGADPAIIGRAIVLNGDPYTVVGVMPREFENVLSPSAEAWTTLQYDMTQGRAWGHHLRMAGRLRPGVSPEDANRELETIARSPLPELARPEWAAMEPALRTTPLHADLTRGVRPALLAIVGAVALLLVIACVNVTNLLLARGVQRRGEFALRAALGASRGRLNRQVLTESLLLAALGGALGMGVAVLGVKALIALSPPTLPRAGAIGVNGTVFLLGFAITSVIGLAFGIAPALQASRNDPHASLQYGSPRAAGGHRRARAALVIAEVSLALVLLVTSGLLFRSLDRLFAVEPGLDPAGLLTMQVQTAGHRFRDDSTTDRFFRDALGAVRRVPGVTSAAFTSQLPLSGDLELYGVHFDPRPADEPGEVKGTFRHAVSPGYFQTMGIPLRSGRALEERDRAGAPLVAVISESMARRRLPGLDPVGQRLRIGSLDGPLYTVVGVVGDVRQVTLALTESEAVYTTPEQWDPGDNAMSLVVRTRGDAAALAPAIRQAIWSVDKDQPIVRTAPMDALVAASAAERRFALIVFEVFALAALVLAAAGIYGILAGSVAERTREIGVRSALGASRAMIVGLVVRQGLTLTACGVLIGLAGAAGASQAIVSMLFAISPLDPATYAGVIAVLGGVALLACCIPAWRAARVDPATTLRTE
jgi:putative ABC transport system permease protein